MSSTARDQWQGTAGYDELFNAVLQVLAKRGVLAQMRANTISEVLACAKNQSGEELVQLLGNPTRDSFTSTGNRLKTRQTHQSRQVLLETSGLCCRCR